MLETGWELEPKYVPQLFLGLLLVTCQSAIGQFFFCLSPVTVPEVFAEVNSVQSPSRFHTGEWKPRDMSTFPFCSTVFSLGARRQIAKK